MQKLEALEGQIANEFARESGDLVLAEKLLRSRGVQVGDRGVD